MGRILGEIKWADYHVGGQWHMFFGALAAKLPDNPVGGALQQGTAENSRFPFTIHFVPGLTMQTKPVLEFHDVQNIATAAQAEASRNHWAVSIAIVDDGGHLLHFQRLDGAAAVSSAIAPAKARTAALGRRESKVYEDMINGGRQSFLSVPALEGMLEGGVPILKDGHCLGAVGVSGVKSHEDAQVARAGIQALAS